MTDRLYMIIVTESKTTSWAMQFVTGSVCKHKIMKYNYTLSANGYVLTIV